MKKPALLVCMAALAAAGAHAAPAGQPADGQIDAALMRADVDRDGKVDRAEATRFGLSEQAFRRGNTAPGHRLDRQELKTAMAAQFLLADHDRDGALDPREAGRAGVRTRAAFQAADRDGDGALDLAEYVEALTRQPQAP